MSKSPIQRIIFGNPGTGKSHSIDKKILPLELGIDPETSSSDIIKTVFHPEYTYGDFMGKLLPLSKQREDGSSQVEYKFYPGHLLTALAKAYKNLMTPKDGKIQNVALVIDEINRGNSSAIFGTAFQLLDRKDDGFSSYHITLSELEFSSFINMIGEVKAFYIDKSETKVIEKYELIEDLQIRNPKFKREDAQDSCDDYVVLPGQKLPYFVFESNEAELEFKQKYQIDLKNRQIRLPPNLSLIGTMNTSDNSIYFMDSAFKRRWDWSFYDWDEDAQIPNAQYNHPLSEGPWKKLVKSLNSFLKSKHEVIRGIEDKQVGYYFIKSWNKGGLVNEDEIQSKLMFFVWDSVFQRDKRPLLELINEVRSEHQKLTRADLVTFGDFCHYHNEFVNALLSR